jgi:hypothetical protein
MKTYKPIISLIRNSRGCYILDTIKGCSGCNQSRPLGCYDNCYAQNIASRYNFNFQETVKRCFNENNKQLYFLDFSDTQHLCETIQNIKKIEMPFVRIGEMGDPSEDWEHTIKVCSAISCANKPIVIITKHWNIIPDNLLSTIRLLNITINTSISAMDTEIEIDNRLKQYKRLKKYCNSVIRIVSCDFNKENKEGHRMSILQDKLFKNDNIIDTVFRPYKNNRMVTENVIKVKKVKFLRSNVLASMYNKNAYLGMCDTCPDMCGVKEPSCNT